MPSPYNYYWRTVLRPETLQRDCYECVRCGVGDRPRGLRSALEVAHLSGDATDPTPDNLATLCCRCHKAQDYPAWSVKYRAWLVAERERKIDERDAERPILEYLKLGTAAFFAGKTIEDLRTEQNVPAITDLDSFGEVIPEEDLEAFVAEIYRDRDREEGMNEEAV